MNAFIDTTQSKVSGKVKVRLFMGNAKVVSRSSPNAIYTRDVSFDVKTEQNIEGLLYYHGLQGRFSRQL